MTIPWTVGTTPDDRYALFDELGNEVARFDDPSHPGEAEPNKSRAEAVLDAIRLVELVADENPENLRGLSAMLILRKAGIR